MKNSILYTLILLFTLTSCGSSCDQIFNSFQRDQVYDYVGFENSSYWTLSNDNGTIEVKKKTYSPSLSSSCDQLNIMSDWIIDYNNKEFVVQQRISHNKKIKHSFAEVTQHSENDTYELTTVHYNKALRNPQNDSTFYFLKNYKDFKNVLTFQFNNLIEKQGIEAIYIAPKVGPVAVKMSNQPIYILESPNAVMAEVEDFK